MCNTHAAKAESYDIGRPEYPAAFFDFLYNENEAGFKKSDIIADIGCGTGKVTKHFLERGNNVIAVEPDADMLNIANKKLSTYPNFVSFLGHADNTNIKSASTDRIFCGNSYQWFNREKTVPEFKRILRKHGTVVIANLGGGTNRYNGELNDIYENFKESVTGAITDNSPPFLTGTFLEKTFEYTVHEILREFLHGALSASCAPVNGADSFEPFCNEIKELFDKYSKNEKLEAVMKLYCAVGKAENLAV